MMSPEARAAASDRMKKMRADQKAKKADPVAPLVTQTINATPPNGKTIQPLDQVLKIDSEKIVVSIDWQNIPIQQGQSFYAILKNEFEKAGRILNARLMAEHEGYTCFQCHTYHAGRPGMTDLSYKDPKSGLFPRVDLCGELCVREYHKFRIDERLAEHLKEAAEQRGA
jgi:hypothetical protein